MQIGIIGAGYIGGTLARHLVRLGHRVSVANSRGPQSLTALAAETGAAAVTVEEAARAADLVIVTIPQRAIADLPADLFAQTPDGVPIVDTGNYYPAARDGRIAEIDAGRPDSQWVADRIGRPVIKVFNNIMAKSLDEGGKPAGTPGRIALPVAGDAAAPKRVVLELVESLGFDAVDAGGIADSWRQQPGTPAYCHDLDAAALRRALADADRSRGAEYRAEADALAQRFLAALREGRDPFKTT